MRLRRADRSLAGFVRVRRGRGFAYLDAGGERIVDDETIQRIEQLAIPPAWREVWICSDPRGHLQATGIDAAGRTQYLYHTSLARAARPPEVPGDGGVRAGAPGPAQTRCASGCAPTRNPAANALPQARRDCSISGCSGLAASSTPMSPATSAWPR